MAMFRHHGYQLGLFASMPLYRTVGLDRTALARIPNLRLDTTSPSRGSSAKDRAATAEWHEWLARRDPSRPFFWVVYCHAPIAFDPPAHRPPVLPPPPGPATPAPHN